jgi:hypothetical protein
MKTLPLLIGGSLILLVCAAAYAEYPHCNRCSHDSVCYRCVAKPGEPEKKTIYDCKLVPFCLPKLPKLFSHCCHLDCGPVRFKRVLMKAEVSAGSTCEMKCEVEKLPPCVDFPCLHGGFSNGPR